MMNEMAMTADHLVIVGRGRLIADMSLAAFTAQSEGNSVLVRSDRAAELRSALQGVNVSVSEESDGSLDVAGLTARDIGEKAAAAGIALHELTPRRASLEDAFMAITGAAVQYHGGGLGPEAGDSVPSKERIAA